jgi:hypothetical protein
MTASITSLTAAEHAADLRRFAERRRAVAGTHQPQVSKLTKRSAVSLRIAGADDEQTVRDLAALDDAPVPEGQMLLALIDGDPAAALSLRDGRVVANPFVHTAEAVALLRIRAGHLSGRRPRRRRPFVLRPRFA